MSEFVKGIMPDNPEQTEIDKQVCLWLNDKRLGKTTKEEIKRRIIFMQPDKSEKYQDALRRYGPKFLEKQ